MESLPSSLIPHTKSVNRPLVCNNLNIPINLTGNFIQNSMSTVRTLLAGEMILATTVVLPQNVLDITKTSSSITQIPSLSSSKDLQNPGVNLFTPKDLCILLGAKASSYPPEVDRFPEAFWGGTLSFAAAPSLSLGSVPLKVPIPFVVVSLEEGEIPLVEESPVVVANLVDVGTITAVSKGPLPLIDVGLSQKMSNRLPEVVNGNQQMGTLGSVNFSGGVPAAIFSKEECEQDQRYPSLEF